MFVHIISGVGGIQIRKREMANSGEPQKMNGRRRPDLKVALSLQNPTRGSVIISIMRPIPKAILAIERGMSGIRPPPPEKKNTTHVTTMRFTTF
ncbi:MAG: hypothetical protein DDT31_01954 [Syntrophomonadaceae bacterium]|nr:hypothetical protein [Bacillota bacterium]